MRPARVVALVVGSIMGIASLGLVLGGAGLMWAHATQRDANGYYNAPAEWLETDTYAITSGKVDLGADQGGEEWNPVDHVGTVRLRMERADGREVFVGIAPRTDVERYLRSVAHDELLEIDSTPRYRRTGGAERPAAPAGQEFWVASAVGAGLQTLSWDLEEGEWAAVVMNADASPGLRVEADAAIRTGWLLAIGGGLLAAGLVAAALALTLILISSRGTGQARAGAPAEAPAPPAAAPQPAAPQAYPLRLDGHLDPNVSRWLWLVKWFLAFPHFVVLALLWGAMAVLTVVAGASIFFTGRYPRSLFDFNVGVLRWTWRVTFYAFALGTDRYPPFSLEDDPDYPARLEVAYPAALSRPLVLVKWWLLALPHYLVLAVFGGGLTWWAWEGATGDGSAVVIRGGLIGFLVLIAAVVLLFTGRYPQSLFDFVMGMERWTFRVFAYAGLMTDEYPPFRLDNGGDDGGATKPSSPALGDPGLAPV